MATAAASEIQMVVMAGAFALGTAVRGGGFGASDFASLAGAADVGEGAACGEVDILVNSAGAVPRGTLLEIDEERWRKAWDLKLFGAINLTREIYRPMCARGRGVIINIAGMAGERPDWIGRIEIWRQNQPVGHSCSHKQAGFPR